MFPVNSSPPEHINLLLNLSQRLTSDDTSRLKMRCQANDVGLKVRMVENKSALEVLRQLDRRRVFRHTNYSRLALILKDINREDLVRTFLNQQNNGGPSTLSSTGYAPSSSSSQPGGPSTLSSTDTGYTQPSSSSQTVAPPVRVVREVDLARLSTNIGREWRMFGIMQLGLSDTDIAQIQLSKPHVNLKDHIFDMLMLWRKREGRKATKDALIQKLEAHPINWDGWQFLKEESESF